MKIIECVPNFSEGRDREKVEAIVGAVRDIPDVTLLDYSMDKDHNRCVLTFIGSPDQVFKGALAAGNKAVELIDMRSHFGEHPRIGAVDVVPFIPLGCAGMSDAVGVAHRFGQAFGTHNRLPVFFYGEAAMHPSREKLSDIRRGGYEALREKMKNPAWRPDAGQEVFNVKSGATAVGARMPLIAFNINLNTDDLGIAKTIARAIRASSGGLPCVKAIGVYLKSRRLAQVSMNLTDYRATSIRTVYDLVREKTRHHGVDILESELIGLVPQAALKGISPEYLKLREFSKDRILDHWTGRGA